MDILRIFSIVFTCFLARVRGLSVVSSPNDTPTNRLVAEVNAPPPSTIDDLRINDHSLRSHSAISQSVDNLEVVKRKWGENSMSVWGKRSGKKVNSVKSEAKRKWGENSMSVWGKRALRTALDRQHSANSGKRRWGENSMSVWGKRKNNEAESTDGVKRRWGENSMSVWGKRNTPASVEKYQVGTDSETVKTRSKRETNFDLYDEPDCRVVDGRVECDPRQASAWESLTNSVQRNELKAKRKWGENSMLVWGKRLAGDLPEKDEEISVGGDVESEKTTVFERCALRAQTTKDLTSCWNWRTKRDDKRRWDPNPIKVWGKRRDLNKIVSRDFDDLGTDDGDKFSFWKSSESSSL